jgi:hypothetical protein
MNRPRLCPIAFAARSITPGYGTFASSAPFFFCAPDISVEGREWTAQQVGWPLNVVSSAASSLERKAMALAKKKRVGKRTIPANQVRKTASGRKRRKADGTQPPKDAVKPATPATS